PSHTYPLSLHDALPISQGRRSFANGAGTGVTSQQLIQVLGNHTMKSRSLSFERVVLPLFFILVCAGATMSGPASETPKAAEPKTDRKSTRLNSSHLGIS